MKNICVYVYKYILDEWEPNSLIVFFSGCFDSDGRLFL